MSNRIEEKESTTDINYVHTLYAYANENPSKVSQIAFILISSLITIAIIWASIAEIDELARGNGKVIPTDKIQRIQSLDGGIISEILVKEGKIVKKGEHLLQIDTTRFQASLEESMQEYLKLLAIRTRLEAEQNMILDEKFKFKTLIFSSKVLEHSSRYDKIEQKIFTNRINEFRSNIKVLKSQLGQKVQEYKEILSTIKNLEKNLEFIEEQRKTMRRLVKRRIKSKYDLLNIEKEYNKTSGDLKTATLSISRSKLAIEEAKGKLEEKLNNFKTESSYELQKTSGDINKFEAILVSDVDKVAKTVIFSPVDGIIKQINTNTVGGVVQPGTDLMEIVPISNILLVEAKIDPKDIAFINPSQKAIVKITAYDFSIYGGLDGTIEEISADSIVDKESKDGKSYYRVLVKTDKNFLERNDQKLPIIPGMVASVDIITGKKTILDFLLKPILKVKQNAFHER